MHVLGRDCHFAQTAQRCSVGAADLHASRNSCLVARVQQPEPAHSTGDPREPALRFWSLQVLLQTLAQAPRMQVPRLAAQLAAWSVHCHDHDHRALHTGYAHNTTNAVPQCSATQRAGHVQGAIAIWDSAVELEPGPSATWRWRRQRRLLKRTARACQASAALDMKAAAPEDSSSGAGSVPGSAACALHSSMARCVEPVTL